MMHNVFLCSFSVFLICNKCHGANILSYTATPSYSHQIAFRPLWQELAKRGHKLTLLTTNLMEDNENITQIDLSETYKIMERYNLYNKLSSNASILQTINSTRNMFREILEYELLHPEVQKILKKEKTFDLVFAEVMTTVGLIFGVKSNAPTIGIVSMDAHMYAHQAVGNPTHPIANPDVNLPFSTNLSFKERVLSTLYWLAWRIVLTYILMPFQIDVLKKCIGEEPPMDEIINNMSMLFINACPIFNNIRPLGPKTINIVDGLHLVQPKLLPEDLQEYLDNAQEGVIYFSLGSNVKSSLMSNRTIEIMLKTFSQLPYQILWKFEDELIKKPNNVKIQKWMPQQDVLRHKNVKLFITQGGVQSMLEAIFNHVPMIGIPFFGDQYGNVVKMVDKGMGLSLDHANIDVDTFKNTILEVINNASYKENTIELSDLTLDRQMTGLEEAVWWTEYVLRHKGTEHFKDSSKDLPLYQYYLLDVISFVFAVFLCAIYVFYKICGLLYKLFKYLFKIIVGGNEKIKIS